jgi:phosphoglycolate phosphatase-like HAD superfamily hydrolase
VSVSAVKKPHIVWDWNGTLFDDVELIVAAANHLGTGSSPA